MRMIKSMPSSSSPEPTIGYIYDLDFFKDFKNEFPAIAYNNNLKSKSDPLIEPSVISRHIKKFETSLSEYHEEEQSDLYFNDSFPLDVIFPDNLKTIKDNVNNIDITHPSRSNVINIDTEGSNELPRTNHDKINKVLSEKFFIITLNANIVSWNYLNNWMPLNLIQNLYVPFGIPFDPKRYYKDGAHTRILQRPRDQRNPWLRYQVEGYGKDIIHSYEQRLETIWGRSVNHIHVLDFVSLTEGMRQAVGDRLSMVYTGDEGQELFTSHAWRRLFKIRAPSVREFILGFLSTCRMSDTEMGLDVADTLCFQLGGDLRSMDRGTANVTYLLAQYLFKHAEGRKSGARLSGGHFIGRLAAHFGLVSDQGLRGLSVASRPERQPKAAVGAPGAVEDAHAADEGSQADPAPMQAP
ncbi:hypothetical protein Tco_1398639 [Tanacetum coccineum]